ncbi:hypothetical protein [Vibrio harveyi]|uniref:hypothetical protein n=1 Tax=Vibrio harveyi TaxID=669 RepID=UPI003BB5DA8C|nr:hypothetical protein [Vibrio parahaemolyticus]
MVSKVLYHKTGFNKSLSHSMFVVPDSPQHLREAIEVTRADLIRNFLLISNRRFLNYVATKNLPSSEKKAIKSYFDSRVAIIDSCLVFDGYLRLSEVYDYLIADEKRVYSYNFGMLFSRVFCEKVLDIQFMYDYDFQVDNQTSVMGAILPTQQVMNDIKPDLIGRTLCGEWVIFEAKGKCANIYLKKFDNKNVILGRALTDASKKTLSKALKQAQKITAINGKSVLFNVAGITSISREKIDMYVKDPESDFYNINVDVDRYTQCSVNIFWAALDALSDGEYYSYNGFTWFPLLTCRDLHIGFDETNLQYAANLESYKKISLNEIPTDRELSFGNDGVGLSIPVS